MEGSGSIWNANSWHWEEKNYNSWAKEVLSSRITALTMQEGDLVLSVVSPLTRIEGEAAINIRKGKQIVLFTFEIEAKWLLKSSDTEVANGTFKLPEFDQSDLDDFDLQFRSETPNLPTSPIKSALIRQLRAAIKQILVDLDDAMRKIEGDREKLEADKKRRAEEQAKMQAAMVTKEAEEHQRILTEALSQEEAKRQELLQKRLVEGESVGQGSSWNVGSYFWEERNIPWANARLKELLTDVKVAIPGGELTFNQTEVKGDAGLSIRKGKKLVCYMYEIKLDWTGRLMDGEGNVTSCKGEAQILEHSSDTPEDLDFRATITERMPGSERAALVVNTRGKEEIAARLAQFNRELQAAQAQQANT
jgi:activator of HSP90 ATPase